MNVEEIIEQTSQNICDGCWTAIALDQRCTKEHIRRALTQASALVPNKERVVIIVEGGVVQEVFVSHPTIAVEIIDHDNLAESGHSRASRANIEREACAGLSDANVSEIGGA